MEQTAACVLNGRFDVSSLRACGAAASSLSNAAGQTVRQSLNPVRYSRTLSLACDHLASGDFQNCAGALPERRARKFRGTAASSGGKDLPGRSCIDQNLRVPGRLDSRLHRENLSRGVDRQAASASGIINAVTLVEQAQRISNSLFLTSKDLLRHSRSLEGAEPDLASQKSSTLADSVGDESSQLCVAVDVDEVLGSFLAALNVFIEETYSLRHDISEYYIYDFMKIWKCSQTEANHRVHAFFESDHFKNGISPIPGAHQTLLQLADYCQLVVVTSRQHIIREPTLAWIDRYYAGIFKEVHFGNHFALEGSSKPKSEICRSLGAQVLIDDNPRYAMDCAANGIEVLLFDLHGSYPWSKTPCGPEHPLITRVKDWQEVEQALLARTCAEL